MLIGTVTAYSTGAILTFAIPIGTLMLAIGYGFYQRKPPERRSRRSLFPAAGLPQRAHDLKLLEAMKPEEREALARLSHEGTPASERYVGGN